MGQVCGKALRPHPVVGVHACNQGSSALAQSVVEGADQPFFWVGVEAHAVVPGGERPNQGGGAVPAVIVHRHQFPAALVLVEDALQGFIQGGFGVPERHENGNEGFH